MTETKQRVRVAKIEIVTAVDEISQPDYLGVYDAAPEAANKPGAIEVNDAGKRYWFVPENPEYAKEDYERLLAFERGDWHFVGVFARATLEVNVGNVICQTIQSGGVWGTECDSDPDYIEEELGVDQYEELVDILKALGIPEDDIPAWEDVDPAKHGE